MPRKRTQGIDVPPVYLFENELVGITGYKQAAYQKRYFDAIGVPAEFRPDNTLIVIRAHLENPPGKVARNDERYKRVRIVRKAA